MNVLIVHRYFWPENIAEEPFMLKEIVAHHLRKGDNVTVVCGTSSENNELYAEHFGVDRFSISCFPSAPDRELGVWVRLLNALRLLYLAMLVLHRREYDLCHVYTYPPFFCTVLAICFRVLKPKMKIVANVQDIVVYLFESRITRWAYDWSLRLFCRNADVVVTLSAAMRQTLIDKYHVASGKIEINQNFNYVETPRQRTAEKIYDIVYAGNLGKAQDLMAILCWLELLRENHNINLTLAVFGDGTEERHLRDYASSTGVNAVFFGKVPREELSLALSKGKFGLISCRGDLFSYAFPSKFGFYLLHDMPVIVTTSDANIRDYVDTKGFGLCIDPYEPDEAKEYAEVILAGYANPDPSLVSAEFSKEGHLKNYEKYIT